jgi:hypothetical protein
MGFCPYLRQAHRSDGTTSPLLLGRPLTPGGAAAPAGMHTTFFVWLFLPCIVQASVIAILRAYAEMYTKLINHMNMNHVYYLIFLFVDS